MRKWNGISSLLQQIMTTLLDGLYVMSWFIPTYSMLLSCCNPKVLGLKKRLNHLHITCIRWLVTKFPATQQVLQASNLFDNSSKNKLKRTGDKKLTQPNLICSFCCCWPYKRSKCKKSIQVHLLSQLCHRQLSVKTQKTEDFCSLYLRNNLC